ncbi:uncharacterized protein LOC21408943 [Morus notabilis]|uniref:uncharacterized protein LOC21408943 n=1 Tax=Morus notabilis TaxID=981085 RepID=UPI000CED6C01|nr:uncharacterized protein LOC21408943 [Morus notabilis]
MPKNEVKSKSVRRPLRDLANNIGGGRSSRPVTTATKRFTQKEKIYRPTAQEDDDEEEEEEEEEENEELLLIQSDLSYIIGKFDELVVKASKLKLPSKAAREELESFAHDLSEMRSSLKPWVPRLARVVTSSSLESENQSRMSSVSQSVSAVNEVETEVPESPEKTNLDFLISPSPLVSWRANCTIERGRQMFLLTPLPISKTLPSSKHPDPPKLVFERVASDTLKKIPPFSSISMGTKYDLLEDIEIQPTPVKPSYLVATETTSNVESGAVSPLMFSKSNCSMVVMTPCIERSPPKSCVLLGAISESTHAGKKRIHKSTPFPVGIKKCSESYISESSSSGSEAPEGIALKYPELLGIRGPYKSGVTKKQIEASPDWFRSPPKTCVLIDPSDEPTLDNDVAAANCRLRMPVTGHAPKSQTNVPLPEVDSQDTDQQVKKTVVQEPLDGNLSLVASTPIWKEPQSTNRRGKPPGENTLKKELWTKFEAASNKGLHISVSVLQEPSQKGFLDRLDEVCCDGEI